MEEDKGWNDITAAAAGCAKGVSSFTLSLVSLHFSLCDLMTERTTGQQLFFYFYGRLIIAPELITAAAAPLRRIEEGHPSSYSPSLCDITAVPLPL